MACHYGEAGDKGAAYKPDDTAVAFGCNVCHDWLDGRLHPDNETEMLGEDSVEQAKIWYWFRAMRRTWRILVEDGVLK